MKRIVEIGKQIIPERLKKRIRRSKYFERKRGIMFAESRASTSKRLDICSSQIAHVLHLSGLSDKLPLRGKICLEVGSGWILSHSLVFWLLGAKRVIASDIQRVAYPDTLYQSIHSSIISIIRDVLSPFEEHSKIRARLDNLISVKTFSFDVLRELGIIYVAPIDLAKRPLNTKIDFIYSNSVLEHVPINDVFSLLENLAIDLSPKGKMIHCIHLEDHNDFQNDPFDFLSEPVTVFTEEVQNKRGNRIRRSQWSYILSQVKDIEFRFVYEWKRRDKKLPTVIDPSIHYEDAEDLKVSHIGILGVKKN